jgi:hypothetical protein
MDAGPRAASEDDARELACSPDELDDRLGNVPRQLRLADLLQRAVELDGAHERSDVLEHVVRKPAVRDPKDADFVFR